VNLYADRETFSSSEKFNESLSRLDVKDNIIDWPLGYGRRRAFDTASLMERFLRKVEHLRSSLKNKLELIVNPISTNNDNKDRNNKENINILNNESIEWDKLKQISDNSIKMIIKFKELSSKSNGEINLSSDKAIRSLINKVINNSKLMEQLKCHTPNFAKHIAFNESKNLKKDLGWQSLKLKSEWEKLRGNTDPTVRLMVEFYDLSLQKNDPSKIKAINQSITRLAQKIENMPVFSSIKKVAPNLSALIRRAKNHNKLRGKDIES
jgi:hypothetical protein